MSSISTPYKLKISLGEFRWAFEITFLFSFVVFFAAFIAHFNSNFTLFAVLLTANLWIGLKDMRKGITLFLILSFFCGLLNRISYNFSPVDFNFLYALPEFTLFGLGVIAVVQHVQKNGFRFQTSLLDRIIILLIIWSFLQALNPDQNLEISLYGIRFRIVPIFLYFLARVYVQEFQHFINFYKLLVILVILTAAYGIFQSLAGLPNYEFVWIKAFPDILAQQQATMGGGQGGWYNDGVLRFFSTFSGGNEFNYVMAFCFVFLVGSNPIKGEIRWQIARWIGISLILFVILLTRERTPLVMILLGVFVLFFLRIRPFLATFLIILIVIGIIIGLAFFIQANKDFTIRLLGGNLAAIRLVELTDPFQADTVVWRVDVKWLPALQMMEQNPFGYGLGATRYSRVTRNGSQLVAPHNTFLEFGLEVGYLGLFLFICTLAEFIRRAFKLKRISRPIRYMKSMPDTLIAVLVSAIACAFVSTVLLDTAGLMVWLFIGLVPVMHRLIVKNQFEGQKA